MHLRNLAKNESSFLFYIKTEEHYLESQEKILKTFFFLHLLIYFTNTELILWLSKHEGVVSLCHKVPMSIAVSFVFVKHINS